MTALIRTPMLAHGLSQRAMRRELPLPPLKPSQPGANTLETMMLRIRRTALSQLLKSQVTAAGRPETTTSSINIEDGKRTGEGDHHTRWPVGRRQVCTRTPGRNSTTNGIISLIQIALLAGMTTA